MRAVATLLAMAPDPDRDALARTAEHIQETRRRLAEGEVEIRRQRAAVAENDRHIDGVRRWIETTERLRGEERPRRDAGADDDLPPAA